MNYYHIWCNLKDSHRDMQFVQAVNSYLGFLKEKELLSSFSLTRRKLGFGPPELGEFHVVICVDNLDQLDRAFGVAATRAGEAEQLHAKVYSMITDFRSGLYRDFPDSERKTPIS